MSSSSLGAILFAVIAGFGCVIISLDNPVAQNADDMLNDQNNNLKR